MASGLPTFLLRRQQQHRKARSPRGCHYAFVSLRGQGEDDEALEDIAGFLKSGITRAPFACGERTRGRGSWEAELF